MKKTFGKKAVAAAVAAGLSSMAAQAVYVNPDGLGQALIYPYYTVQQVGGNGYNTLISVVNTTGDAKAVKVRIREGKASAEVLDFLLFLSPYDVWTAAIVPVDGTETSGAKIISADTSCIYPRKLGLAGVPFRNFKYAKDAVKDSALARTREGYIEMIEAATVTGALAADVTHTAGVPKCKIAEGLSDGLLVAPNATTPYNYATNPSGGLMGQVC